VLESIARGDLAKLLDIERIDAQVFVILEIVDRRDAMFVAQPFEIVFAGIFADQQVIGYLTD